MARLGIHRVVCRAWIRWAGGVNDHPDRQLFAIQLCMGLVSRIELSPRDFGLEVQFGVGIRGGGVEHGTCVIAKAVLNGERGAAPRYIVLIRYAALALVAAEKAVKISAKGVARAEESIDSMGQRAANSSRFVTWLAVRRRSDRKP